MIVVVDPDFASLTYHAARYAGEKAITTKHTYPVVDPYRQLLALPQNVACIGEESEWKIISSKAGAGYFGHNELN